MITRCLLVALLLSACTSQQPAATTATTSAGPGPLSDTWRWSIGIWQRADVAGPSPRYKAAMTYDVARRNYVLFGGQAAHGSSDETWTWDGKSWKKLSPAHRPAPRRGAAMGYDPGTGLVVLYGGLVQDRAEGREAADTWTWDGTDWTELIADHAAPGNRESASMLTASSTLLLFGGHVANVAYFGDVWGFTGRGWIRYDVAAGPEGRYGAAVAWNANEGQLFIYGGTGIKPEAGIGALGRPLGDGWMFTLRGWQRIQVAGPPPLENASAYFDRRYVIVVVLFGVACPNPSSTAWSWDGRQWAQSQTKVPPRWGAAVAQNPLTGELLVFGGSNEPGC